MSYKIIRIFFKYAQFFFPYVVYFFDGRGGVVYFIVASSKIIIL